MRLIFKELTLFDVDASSLSNCFKLSNSFLNCVCMMENYEVIYLCLQKKLLCLFLPWLKAPENMEVLTYGKNLADFETEFNILVFIHIFSHNL